MHTANIILIHTVTKNTVSMLMYTSAQDSQIVINSWHSFYRSFKFCYVWESFEMSTFLQRRQRTSQLVGAISNHQAFVTTNWKELRLVLSFGICNGIRLWLLCLLWEHKHNILQRMLLLFFRFCLWYTKTVISHLPKVFMRRSRIQFCSVTRPWMIGFNDQLACRESKTFCWKGPALFST